MGMRIIILYELLRYVDPILNMYYGSQITYKASLLGGCRKTAKQVSDARQDGLIDYIDYSAERLLAPAHRCSS